MHSSSHFCWTLRSGVLSHGCGPLPDQVQQWPSRSHLGMFLAVPSMSDTISVVLRHAVAGVVLSWVWSFVWSTPPLFGWGTFELEGVKTSCAPKWHSRDVGDMSYMIIFFFLCFALPFSVVMVSYSRLLWTLRQVSNKGCAHHVFLLIVLKT